MWPTSCHIYYHPHLIQNELQHHTTFFRKTWCAYSTSSHCESWSLCCGIHRKPQQRENFSILKINSTHTKNKTNNWCYLWIARKNFVLFFSHISGCVRNILLIEFSNYEGISEISNSYFSHRRLEFWYENARRFHAKTFAQKRVPIFTIYFDAYSTI